MSLNHRQHWRAKAEATKVIREGAFLLAKHHKLPKGCSRVRLTLIYRPMDPGRRRDVINLVPTLKAAEDGLVQFGLIPDDTSQYSEPTMPVIQPPRAGQRRAEVLVLVERLA